MRKLESRIKYREELRAPSSSERRRDESLRIELDFEGLPYIDAHLVAVSKANPIESRSATALRAFSQLMNTKN